MHRNPNQLLIEYESAVAPHSGPEAAFDIVPSCTEFLTPRRLAVAAAQQRRVLSVELVELAWVVCISEYLHAP